MKKQFSGLLIIAIMFTMLISCNSEQPNVILIMADDMGAECLKTYGGISYHTPNLDRMAKEGLLVSHCISQPLCTPSRVKLMTGLYNNRNYEFFGYLNTTGKTIGNVMQEAGYRTCISGKWQLNGLSYPKQLPEWNDPTRPNQMGFDEYCLWQLTKKRSEGERYADPLIEQNGHVLDLDKDSYGPDIFCDFVLDFIDRNQGKPFFAYYPMVLVHDPFVPTPDSEEWDLKNTRYEQDTAYFRDMVTYADRIVGRIINRLEENGIRENTILIFTADNGTSRRIVSHTTDRKVIGAKGKTISDGVHVPLLVTWPFKIRKAIRFDGLIEFSDFFPTLADLAGIEVISDGRSFLPLLIGKKHQERETVKVHYDPRWSDFLNSQRNTFVQTQTFKLYQDGLFFNLKKDILEQHPISKSDLNPGEAAVYKQLEKELF